MVDTSKNIRVDNKILLYSIPSPLLWNNNPTTTMPVLENNPKKTGSQR